jgi:hypothetical protein
MKTHTLLVQKLISRSVTGRGLRLSVHAHTGCTIHLSWNPGVRTGSYQNCVARHTIHSGVWHAILRQLRRRGLMGICKCVYGVATGYEKETLDEVCFHTTYAVLRYYCRCKFEFSLEFGENYRSSIFLPEGCMMLFEAVNKSLGQC